MSDNSFSWNGKILSIIIGSVLFAMLLSFSLPKFFFPQSDQFSAPKNSSAFIPKISEISKNKKQSGIGRPMLLEIPKINIKAAIIQVGLTPLGAMDAPKELTDTAWFKLGPRPGEKGSAVIAGHYGWKNGKAGVFNFLHKLQKGDKLSIKDDKGSLVSFVVRNIIEYGQNADTNDVFNSSDTRAHLNLIACDGVWDNAQKSYSKRLVVFTDKE